MQQLHIEIQLRVAAFNITHGLQNTPYALVIHTAPSDIAIINESQNVEIMELNNKLESLQLQKKEDEKKEDDQKDNK